MKFSRDAIQYDGATNAPDQICPCRLQLVVAIRAPEVFIHNEPPLWL